MVKNEGFIRWAGESAGGGHATFLDSSLACWEPSELVCSLEMTSACSGGTQGLRSMASTLGRDNAKCMSPEPTSHLAKALQLEMQAPGVQSALPVCNIW